MSKKTRKKQNRSGNEICSICKNHSILICHHINGRDIEDANKSWNLVNICDTCHRKIHEGILIIEKWAMTSSGMELFWHKKGEENILGEESNPYLIPKN